MRVCILAVLFAGVAGLVLPTASVQAADNATITVQKPDSVRAGATFNAMGSYRVNGQPVACVPVALYIRPFGGPDRLVATGVTNANGNYHLSGPIPGNPGPNVQIRVVTHSASYGVVIPVR